MRGRSFSLEPSQQPQSGYDAVEFARRRVRMFTRILLVRGGGHAHTKDIEPRLDQGAQPLFTQECAVGVHQHLKLVRLGDPDQLEDLGMQQGFAGTDKLQGAGPHAAKLCTERLECVAREILRHRRLQALPLNQRRMPPAVEALEVAPVRDIDIHVVGARVRRVARQQAA